MFYVQQLCAGRGGFFQKFVGLEWLHENIVFILSCVVELSIAGI